MITTLIILGLAATSLQTNPDSLLHVGASVRVQVPRVATGWIEGTVTRSSTSSTCLAVRLEREDSVGRPLYVFLRAVIAVEVDQRTNQGIWTYNLPPAEPSDWRVLTQAELAQLQQGCRRAR